MRCHQVAYTLPSEKATFPFVFVDSFQKRKACVEGCWILELKAMVYSSWFTCDLGIQMMSVKGAAVVVMGRKLSSNVH